MRWLLTILLLTFFISFEIYAFTVLAEQDCIGTSPVPCHKCDVNDMDFLIRDPDDVEDTRDWQDMSYASSSGTCETTPEVTETWTDSDGYTFCPKEGSYDILVRAHAEGEDLSTTNLALAANGGSVSAQYCSSLLNDGSTTQSCGGWASCECGFGGCSPYTCTAGKVTLDSIYNINKVVTYWWNGDGRNYGYEVYVSTDDVEWTKVVDKDSGAQYEEIDTFDPVQAKYVKVEGTYNSANTGIHIMEIEVYGAEEGYEWENATWETDKYIVNYDTDSNWCGCIGGRWNSSAIEYETGANPSCCEDDTGEYIITRDCISWCSSDSNDWACCNADSKCVYSSTCYADGGYYEHIKCSSGSWIDEGGVRTPPLWRNQGTNDTDNEIDQGEAINLTAQGKDETALDWAWLATDETGEWKNYTDPFRTKIKYYNSPMDMQDAVDTWTWSNFTWQNFSIRGGIISWRIYYNDTLGNEGATDVKTFTIKRPPCQGYLKFSLEPSFATPSSHILPSVSGLEDCYATAYFKEDSYEGKQVSSCIVTSGECTGNSFSAPESADAYTYCAYVDKNNDGDFNDENEELCLIYMVGYSSLPEFHWIGIVQIMILASVVLILFKKNAP